MPGHPEVFAVGDIAAITDAKTEQVLPQLGSVALQSGEHAGETIARLVAGKKTKPFAYKDKGTMATIGRGAAVVQMLGGKTMKGRKAQAAWGSVHLALLPTNEDRAKAIVDWSGAELTHQRTGRIIVRADEVDGDDATTRRFFEALGARGHEPLLEKATGTLRFDLDERASGPSAGSSAIEKGDIAVSRRSGQGRRRRPRPTGRSSTSWRADGRTRWPRCCAASIERRGRPQLLVLFQRLSPEPAEEAGSAEAAMSDGLVKILDGNTFVVSDARGDIEASLTDPTGLFSFDTRFLSKWVLTVNGERLNALSVDDLQYFETRFFLVPGTGTVYVDAKLSVIRQRAVGDGFHEELTILNHDDEAGRPDGPRRGRLATSPTCSRSRTRSRRRARTTARVEKRRLELGVRARDVQADDRDLGDDAGEDRRGRASRSGSGSSRTALDDRPERRDRGTGAGGRLIRPKYGEAKRARRACSATWSAGSTEAPRLECDWDALKTTYRRSLVDLAALRFSPPSPEGGACRPRACPGS